MAKKKQQMFNAEFLVLLDKIIRPTMLELYKWLTKKTMNGVSDASVKWNFTKFLIDENGKWFACYASPIKPTNDEIIYWIKGGK